MKIAKHKKNVQAIKPATVKPMLCTLRDVPFNDPNYVYEVKWDGYRVIAHKSGNSVRLDSRGGLNFSKKYPSLIAAINAMKHDFIIDGEIVVLNDSGKPDFDALQRFNGGKTGVVLYAFDLLWLDGEDMMARTLLERKEVLKNIIPSGDVIRFSDHFDDGLLLFEQVKQLGMEGIVAKGRDSKYHPDKRGKEWLKIPTALRQEFVIGGWVESDSGRPFRTLLFGAYNDEGELEWIGHAGGGFKEHEMDGIKRRLLDLSAEHSPFANPVEYDGTAHWVKPKLVANIKYATTTRSGKIRKPAIFLGLRKDKRVEDVKKEIPLHVSAGREKNRPPVRSLSQNSQDTTKSNWNAVDQEERKQKERLDLGDCQVDVYNVNREIWRGITKGHLLKYYHEISPYLLPHLNDRPLSLYLKLKGAFAPGIYIKDMEGREPECAEIFSIERKHKKPGKRNVIDYLVCNNKSTLLFAVNLGCVDINPWLSRTANYENPDYLIIDLDPSDEDFGKAIAAASVARDILGKQKITAFVKTSGKTGLHIYIPCTKFSFNEARTLSENLCERIHAQLPALTTLEISVDERGNKLFLDPNQNDFTDTVAAPYTVRPYKHPTVSTPLHWKEIEPKLDQGQFTMDTIHKRLKKFGDIFKGALDRTIGQNNDRQLLKI